ncbi:hypothetical protein PRNP1_010490 [Phytophthora ramorum]
MEADAQYALHDSEAAPLAWAARVRLTPELLQKLRHAPEQILLRLNVATGDGASKTRGNSKKTSLLTVKVAAEETEERYELLSFPEHPGINHVCTFRRDTGDDSASTGYSIYKTGAIHQKLLVQRLLDDTEKDRIKDKHAKSVLASKSRSSKLIDPGLEKPAKRQRLMTRLSSVPTSRMSAGGSAWSAAAGHKRPRKLVLPSSLTKEEAKEAKERIETGFEVEVEEGTADLAAEEKTGKDSAEDEVQEEAPKVIVSAATAAAARDAEFHTLFSSDSDDEAVGAPRKISRGAKGKEVKGGRSATIETDEIAVTACTNETEATGTELDASVQPTKSAATISSDGNIPTDVHTELPTQSKPSSEPRDIYALKPIKPSTSSVEVKRARVRSALVSDRVKQSRLPDLSFFPSVVVQICQRLANYRGRSVVLDESDYDSFLETHEQFRQDWEMLDKAYSIELIKTEGLHLQLEVDSADTNREQLEARVAQASINKKEGLLFVRDAMASIQKVLHSIQASVNRFDMKPH